MATVVVPYRPGGKTRLAEPAGAELAEAMLADVLEACGAVAPTVVADAPGGQAGAVLAALRRIVGPVAVVNADVPCATPEDVAALLAAAPALVAAADGTTNALSLPDGVWFRPLYGPGSAARFQEERLRPLDLPNLADDVDTLEDLERVADRVGPRTRAVLQKLRAAA